MFANMTSTFQNKMKRGLVILLSQVTQQIGTSLFGAEPPPREGSAHSPALPVYAVPPQETLELAVPVHHPMEILVHQGGGLPPVPGAQL